MTTPEPLAAANTAPPELVDALARRASQWYVSSTSPITEDDRELARDLLARVRAYDAEQAATRPIRALVMDLCRALGHDPARVSGIVADVESLEVTEHPALDGRGPLTLRTEYRLNDRPRPSDGAG